MTRGLTIQTKPEPCTEIRGFAHHYPNIHQMKEGDPYAEDTCIHCHKRRLFKVAWPAKLDWNALRAARKLEERKHFRRKARVAA